MAACSLEFLKIKPLGPPYLGPLRQTVREMVRGTWLDLGLMIQLALHTSLSRLVTNPCHAHSLISYLVYVRQVGAPVGTAFPGAQPVSLSRENIGDLKEQDFHVSWKSDGVR